MRVAVCSVLLLCVGWGLAAAQAAPDNSSPAYWIDVFYPKLFATSREGFTAGGYYAFIQPLRFEEYAAPPPYRASIALQGQASTSGSRSLILEVRAPHYVEGWRFVGAVGVRRHARDNYFGIGNDTELDNDNVTGAQPHFYQALHQRLFGRVDVQRRIVGPLRLLAGVQVERWKIRRLDGPSVLALDAARGADPTIGVPTTDATARVGVVLDTRDDEVAPAQGVLVEAIVSGADQDWVGDVSYTRVTVSARGYVPVTSRLRVAGRVAVERMGGTPRFGSYYTFEGSDRASTALGGGTSHRALDDHRFLGRHKLLGNLDARYTVYAIPTLARASVVAFLDVGRVFEDEEFRFTTDDLKVGGGTGLFLHVARAAVAGFTAGVGPDGVVWDFHTRWPF